MASPGKSTGDGSQKMKKRRSRPAHLDLDLEKLAKQSVNIRGHQTQQTPIVQATVSTQNTDVYRAVELKMVSGGALTNNPVVFSADSSLFYLAKDNAVAVYNVQNGEMVQNFTIQQQQQQQQRHQTPAHAVSGTTKPTAILALVGDPDQAAAAGHRVYSFSADHRARLWDADTGELLHTWELGCAVEHAAADPTDPTAFYCATRRESGAARGDKSKYSVERVVLARQDRRARMDAQPVMRVAGLAGLAVRGDGAWVAAFSRFRVHVTRVRRGGKPAAVHRWRVDERVSTIAFQANEPTLAVGDWRGRIVFWLCLDAEHPGGDDRSVARVPHHWHAHRVNAVAFTADGQTMLSGGEEGVLVLWRLATGARDFLPRLGSDILGIAVSPDQAVYAVTLRDNTIRVVSAADRSLVSSLQGLKFAQRAGIHSGAAGGEQRRLARLMDPDPFSTGLVVHPSTRALVLNGEPGFLQVFSHAADRHLASIEVAPFNRVAGTSSSLAAERPHVDIARFSADGAWMATVDSRGAGVCFLKFWRLDAASQSYRLVSRIDNPHMRGRVRDVAFQPPVRGKGTDSLGLLCVTTGADRALRVWELHRADAESFWSCRGSARYRDMEPHGAAFSADGSMAAVSFGNAVTLWDVSAQPPRQMPGGGGGGDALVASALAPALTGVAFVGQTPYLAAWSRQRLDLWNMLTGSVWWTQVFDIQSVFVHPRAPLLAVAAHQVPRSAVASVLVFAPASPNPLLALQHPGGVEAVALVPAAAPKLASGRPLTERGALKPDPLASNTLAVLTPLGLINVYAAESDADAFARSTLSLRSAVDPADVDAAPRPMPSVLFSSIFGGSAPASTTAAVSPVAGADDSASSRAHVRAALRLARSAVRSSYVSAPLHVLPSVDLLFERFAAAQLLPPPNQTTTTVEESVSKSETELYPADDASASDVEMTDVIGAASLTGGTAAPEFFSALRNEFSRCSTTA
ncbi:NET1-associated nuclear protein 1 [Coemansia sp. RSA 2049]|nr:NET1-associated nuclear protein 1 [Coemansia sp. RSA 2049]